ncbi:MAG: hypothetical protein ACXWNQ_03195 [Anaerolineales bacterium]
MKTAAVPSPLNFGVIVLALLFLAVVFVAVTGRRVPVISSMRAAMLALLVIGMAMCALGGIGRVGALGQWAHPLAILGYLLGALILVVALGTIFAWKLPYVHSDQQAVVLVAVFTAAKIVLTLIHSLLPRAG